MAGTIVWITGANHGIGLGIARNTPYPGARIINLSNEPHPDYETVLFDLTDPSTWERVRTHMEEELAAFKGERAIFVQNAHVVEDTGILGKLPYDTYVKGLFGNLVAPLVLAEGFIRGCRPGYESGLVMISAESADIPIPALTTYCASKAGLEQWVMAAKAERAAAPGPWIVAVRTGFTDTPTAHWIAALDESIYPRAGVMREELKSGRGMSIDEVGARFWRLLPPPPEAAAIRLGQAHSNQPLGVIKKVERSFT